METLKIKSLKSEIQQLALLACQTQMTRELVKYNKVYQKVLKNNTEERKDGAQRDERYRKSIIIL